MEGSAAIATQPGLRLAAAESAIIMFLNFPGTQGRKDSNRVAFRSEPSVHNPRAATSLSKEPLCHHGGVVRVSDWRHLRNGFSFRNHFAVKHRRESQENLRGASRATHGAIPDRVAIRAKIGRLQRNMLEHRCSHSFHPGFPYGEWGFPAVNWMQFHFAKLSYLSRSGAAIRRPNAGEASAPDN